MAARSKARRDEDAPDAVEEEAVGAEEDAEDDVEDDFDDEASLGDDELDEGGLEDDSELEEDTGLEDETSLEELDEAGLEGADEEAAEPAPDLPTEVAFDEEDEEIVAVVTAASDDEDDIEGLREGEFVCRSCHMAKRETQLADRRKLLCRDCA